MGSIIGEFIDFVVRIVWPPVDVRGGRAKFGTRGIADRLQTPRARRTSASRSRDRTTGHDHRGLVDDRGLCVFWFAAAFCATCRFIWSFSLSWSHEFVRN